MRSFSDFNIQTRSDRFIGDKIKMLKVLNQEIIVHNFKVDKSKFDNSSSDKCLSLQIEIKGDKYVLFTGSKILTETIQQIPKEELPFKTVISKEGETFQFN